MIYYSGLGQISAELELALDRELPSGDLTERQKNTFRE